MDDDPLSMIRHRINAGDREGARQQLVDLLDTDPKNVDGWALLAILLTEPAEQAECYRQILRIDPEHRLAAAWLDALTRSTADSSVREEVSPQRGASLRCKQCGGLVELHFVGELRDSRAVCPYCGAHIDPLDTLAREEWTREQEELPEEGAGSTESVRVERRGDELSEQWVPPTAEELGKLLREIDLSDADEETLRQSMGRGLADETSEQMVAPSANQTAKRSFLDRVLGRRARETPRIDMLADLADPIEALAQTGRLGPGDIIRLAGGPLSPQERRNCPECGAVVSRTEAKCPWCSAPLPDPGRE